MKIPEIKIHRPLVSPGKWVGYRNAKDEIMEGMVLSVYTNDQDVHEISVIQRVKGWVTSIDRIAPQQLIGFIDEPEYS